MRISDWSSDVCSSDLRAGVLGQPAYDHAASLQDTDLFAHAAFHRAGRHDVYAQLGAGLGRGVAQRQYSDALYSFHGGSRAPGALWLILTGDVRRPLLCDAARHVLGVAVSEIDRTALLAGGAGVRYLFHWPVHRWLAARCCHAGCDAAQIGSALWRERGC